MGCPWEKSWDHSAGREPNLSRRRGLSKQCMGKQQALAWNPKRRTALSGSALNLANVPEKQRSIGLTLRFLYSQRGGPETSQMNHIQLTDVRLERPKETNQYICKQLRHLIIIKVPSVVSLCDPMDQSLPGSSAHGILQTRILERVTIPFSRGSPQARG